MEKPAVTETNSAAIGLFNYAHSYAQSAVTLQDNKTDATHWNAPVYFLYFHAIELYLKAWLVAHGHDLEVLREKHGHRVKPLAKLARTHGLVLTEQSEAVIELMHRTDNVITSRYLRIGLHARLPFTAHFDTCDALHEQIMPKVYENVPKGRRPILREVE
jgi:HEPN domain-containing protein